MYVQVSRVGDWWLLGKVAVRGCVCRDGEKCCAFVFLSENLVEGLADDEIKDVARPLLEVEFALGRWYVVVPFAVEGFDAYRVARYGWPAEWIREPLAVRADEPVPSWWMMPHERSA